MLFNKIVISVILVQVRRNNEILVGEKMYDYKKWKHVFKIDPNKEIDDDTLEKICESGTDAVVVGGTDGVTMDNVLQLLVRIRRYMVPCALEISNLESVVPGFDLYFVPTVLNSKKREWIVGIQQEAMKEYGDIMDWDEIIPEGYCILNPDSKVAELTEADCQLQKDDVVAYARLAENFYRLPVFYLEYSGTYGDVKIVEEVSKQLSDTHLFYGGGIATAKQAKEMSAFAHTVVVGNIIYQDIKEALKTVRAVKEGK